MLNKSPYLPIILSLIPFTHFHISYMHGSAAKTAGETVVVHTVVVHNVELSPLQLEWIALAEAGELQKAVDSVNDHMETPGIDFLYRCKVLFDTLCPSLMRAFIDLNFATENQVSWELLYKTASNSTDRSFNNYLIICQALWEVRKDTIVSRPLNDDKDFLPVLMQGCIYAAIRGDLAHVHWVINTLQGLNRLDLLSKKWHIEKVTVQKRSAYYSDKRIVAIEREYEYLFKAAEDNDHIDMIRLLIKNGVDHTVGGDYPHTSPFGYRITSYGSSWEASTEKFMRAIFFLKSHILDWVRNSAGSTPAPHSEVISGDSKRKHADHLGTARALYQHPELVSRHTIDQNGNNALHLAVLTQNRLLIELCLLANPDIIAATNKNGETALTLAYAKSLHQALWTIIGFCIKVRDYQESSETI